MLKFTDIYCDLSNQYLIDMIKLIQFRRQNPLTYIKLRKNRPQNYIDCQQHHIIPKCIYKELQQPIDNSAENLIYLSVKEHIEIHILIYKYFNSIGDIKHADLTSLAIRYLAHSHEVISYLNNIDHKSKEYLNLVDTLANNMVNAAKANSRIHCGKVWVNNGIQNKFVFPDKIPDGYVLGKIIKDRKGFSDKMKIVNKGKTKNKRWYTNGNKNLYIDSNMPVPTGFIPGMKPSMKKRKPFIRAKGYIYITNGKKNIRIQPNDLIPEGFKKGKTIASYSMPQSACDKISERNKNSIWVNNGIESKFVNKDHIPDGYSKGRIFKCTERKPSSAKNSIWVNNGIISKMVQPDQIPNGFVRGRLKVNKHEQK